MMKIIKIFLLIFLIFGCNNNTKSSDITIPSIKWSKNDEPPSIELCDELNNDLERVSCFKNKLITLISGNLNFSKTRVNKELNDTLFVSILIEKNGKISLLNISDNFNIKMEIPLIDTIISNAISRLPYILPATKTNIGVQVSSKFELPLIIKSD
ncbi:MAG: hypothetical protein O3C01_07080 [Bacteroidetes bacterium]|jgi:hypothetical protein|nr:hypothetical protein [Bacteroidota bacterium]MDA1018940.1 hypothetical protein [Bacteroidota bacterium]